MELDLPMSESNSVNKKILRLLVTISSIIIVTGVFLPLASIPVYGEFSYNHIASVESHIVIIFAVLAPVLIILGKSRLIVISAAGIWTTLRFQQ